MYIIIFEDGSMSYSATISSEELEAADDGILDIVDISDPTHPLRYFDEGWCSLEVANV
tara:strand:+ start:231 stop:404 length:174 start_codon:yes stop_codon:yes gene_type:complete